jgi:plasmid stabilization system protein ParE
LAREDLLEAYERAVENAPIAADRWLDRFESALETLKQAPQRRPLARENSKVEIELREFLFGRRPYVFRVLFTIDGAAVRVLRIRRAQRRYLTAREIVDALSLEDGE